MSYIVKDANLKLHNNYNWEDTTLFMTLLIVKVLPSLQYFV